jgi:type II secretory pathway component PulF
MTLHIAYSDAQGAAGEQWGFRAWLDLTFGFSQPTRLRVYSKLAAKIRQDVSVERTLRREVEKRLKRRQRATARVLEQIEARMTIDAMSFPVAIRPFVPPDEYLMLLAGDKARDLPAAMERICDVKERVARILRVVKSVSMAPLGYMTINIGFVSYLAANVLPSLSRLSDESKTSSDSLAVMIWISRYATVTTGVVVLLLIILLLGAIIYSLPRMTGTARLWLECLPPWSTYRDIQAYLWTCSFISYLVIGVPDTEALGTQADQASPWLRERLDAIRNLMLQHSASLPGALDRAGFNFPSAEIVDDIDESWGGRDDYDRLLKQSHTWISDLEERTIAQATALKIVLTTITILLCGYMLALGNSVGTEMQPPG